jgi:sulfite reductase alpha subunit-like flavoprotein
VPDLASLRTLVETVGAFYVRDRSLVRAQRAIEAALAAGSPDRSTIEAYLEAVRRYFTPFEREAQAQLQHVDRELAKLYQRQYNLTAERGVAVRRIEVTQGVLSALAELAHS